MVKEILKISAALVVGIVGTILTPKVIRKRSKKAEKAPEEKR